jgi:limonene-1,2-epoxide hydrolase
MTTEMTPETTTDASSGQSAQQVVETFISALERLDLEGAVALVSDDIRWVNVPWKSSTDKRGVKRVLGAMFKDATRFEVQYLDIHERGDGIVYTDRVDIFEGGGLRMNLPVKGEFRVEQGLVTEWVDRFSWAKLIGEMGRSLPAILKYRFGR